MIRNIFLSFKKKIGESGGARARRRREEEELGTSFLHPPLQDGQLAGDDAFGEDEDVLSFEDGDFRHGSSY